MQLKTLLNLVQPFKGFIYQSAILCNSYKNWEFGDKVIIIPIKPRKNSKPICSVCETKGSIYDTGAERLFDYLPILGCLVYFAYRMRRVNCISCGVKTEVIPWAEGKSQLTNTLCWYLSSWAKDLSWKRVAEKFQVSWDSVCRSVEMAVNWGLEHRNLGGITSIGVDEISRSKGHKYLTLVYQIDSENRRLLWVGQDRKEKTFNKFFNWLGQEKSQKIKAVCSDMWRPYLKVIKARIPDALHVLDRFHIVAHLGKSVDKVRAEEHRNLIKNGFEAILTKSKWILLRHRSNLKQDQEISLKELLKYNLKTMRAYLLKEEFNSFWEYKSPSWAKKFLKSWTTKCMRSRIEPMKKIAKMIRNHEVLILNWFVAKGELSSGIVEGFNNKAKLTTRKSYGFKNSELQEIALFHALGKLPTPEWTHRFCG